MKQCTPNFTWLTSPKEPRVEMFTHIKLVYMVSIYTITGLAELI